MTGANKFERNSICHLIHYCLISHCIKFHQNRSTFTFNIKLAWCWPEKITSVNGFDKENIILFSIVTVYLNFNKIDNMIKNDGVNKVDNPICLLHDHKCYERYKSINSHLLLNSWCDKHPGIHVGLVISVLWTHFKDSIIF